MWQEIKYTSGGTKKKKTNLKEGIYVNRVEGINKPRNYWQQETNAIPEGEKRENSVTNPGVKSGVRKGHAIEALVNEMTQALTENVT